ncbi:MAG: anthranilate phosphoribosyltransferase [Spirochaetota bacterium]|nr:anthranilate phosphoribosyltransferase [Spirochaetota bacterium]
MLTENDKEFGSIINRIILGEDLSYQEAKGTFNLIISNQVTEMQQGAFLSALTAKGETPEEIAGCWEAIYELDTIHVSIDDNTSIVENCGTGMDSFKTFNISTAASILAAAGGVKMAKHGARGITSVCGTVDIAEILGVDVECSAHIVARSIEKAGIGLFNGMSPEIHPNALGRILSKIAFGSTLNIAASLANPASPRLAVRGVYSKEMILPVAQVMNKIGYNRALVIYGEIEGSDKGMDEASVCGTTQCAELKEDGSIHEYYFRPTDYNLKIYDPNMLIPSQNIESEAKTFIRIISGNQNGARRDAAVLNAGLIYYISDKSADIFEGIDKASETINNGSAIKTLESWVSLQNRDPVKGIKRLNQLI